MNKFTLTDAKIRAIPNPNKRTEFYDSVVSGLVLRVTPTGSKSFALRYRFGDSKQITIGSYGDWTLAVAREKARKLKRIISDGIDPAVQKRNAKELKPKTLLQVIEQYKAMHLPTLKPTTRNDYENRIKSILKGSGSGKTKSRGFNGNRYIKDIKRHEVLDFLEGIARTAPTNAQRIQAILSGIFKFAKNREWIDTNPANEISLTRKNNQLRKEAWKNKAYSDIDIKTLWNAFDRHTEPVGSLLKMLLITGQRSGETRLMKWDNIDFDKKLWTIPETDTKNGIEHYVPLSVPALELLEHLKPWTSGAYVFESPVNKIEPIGHPQKAAQRIRQRYEVDFNIHSLRTTFATRQAGLGTPPQVLSKLMNHKKPGEGSTITAIYNQYDYDDEKRTAMSRWADYLQQIIAGETETIVYKLGS